MKTYFLLDRSSNTWSTEHYELRAILATPGISEEQILSDSRTRQMMTVAQARHMLQQRPRMGVPATGGPKLTLSTPAGSSVAQKKGNKTLTQGMSLNKEKNYKPGDSMPLSSLQKKQEREYKTICRTDSVFNGQFTPHLLSKVLNAHARQGWRVVSSNTAPSYAADGTEYQEFFVLLERG